MPRIPLRLLVVVCFIAGCGGSDATGPDPKSASYERVAGTYAGPFVGTSQGVGMNSTFTVTITQSDESLSGSWALSGTLSDGFQSIDVLGSGAMTGTVQPGSNPSVAIRVAPAECPDNKADFMGTYDSANRRLTLTGPVEVFDPSTCDVLISYQTTIVLAR